MFGFLRPRQEDLRYRSVYSRCCQHLRRHYGLRSTPFHSYEAVFLYACAMDAALFPQEIVKPQQCCKFAGLSGIRSAPDALIGRYCASVAAILADIKLADDIRDNPSWTVRLYRRVMSPSIDRAYSFLRAIDHDATDRINLFLREHALIEAAGNPVAIADYTKTQTTKVAGPCEVDKLWCWRMPAAKLASSAANYAAFHNLIGICAIVGARAPSEGIL